jgi:hypothetical protein
MALVKVGSKEHRDRIRAPLVRQVRELSDYLRNQERPKQWWER